MIRLFSILSYFVAISVAPPSILQAQEKSDVAVAKIGKAASALLSFEASAGLPARPGGGFGGIARLRNTTYVTPICIHPSGAFLVYYGSTNLPSKRRIPVLLHLGTKEQKSANAVIVRHDDNLKCAVVQLIDPVSHPTVSLAKAVDWKSAGDVVTFGLPELRRTISSSTVGISLIVKKSKVKTVANNDGPQKLMLKSIPGTNGGPVLNREGKLAGFHAATGEIVSIDKLRGLLELPVIVFAAPKIDTKNQHKPIEFLARVISLNDSSNTKDLSLKLILNVKGRNRTFMMTRKDGVFRTTAIPVPSTNEKPKFPIRVAFRDGTIEGMAVDQAVNNGKTPLMLSDLRELQMVNDNVKALPKDRKVLTIPTSEMRILKIEIGDKIWPVDLKHAVSAAVGMPRAVATVACSVQATLNGKVVCRSDEKLAISGVKQKTNPPYDDLPLTAAQKRIADVLFQRYDTNGDNRIDAKDVVADALAARFIDRMDRNKDGAVTRSEVAYYYQNRMRAPPVKGGFGARK